jgi:T5SS/PEP-CTERM-associated repeat protein
MGISAYARRVELGITRSRDTAPVNYLESVLLILLLLALPAAAETGITNTIDGINTNAGATFTIGDTGPFNELIITNSGSVSNGVGIIGNAAAADSNTVIVIGTGSAWTNVGAFTLGNSGSDNQLLILNGGSVVGTTVTLGDQTAANNNIAIISGTGSIWTNTGALTIGAPGFGNQLIITNGGKVYVASVTLGSGAAASNNAISVVGSGSLLASAGALTMGGGGADFSQMVIANSGQVFNAAGSIGSNGDSNSVLVTGIGSVWSNSAFLRVGDDRDYARLVISNGATVISSGSSAGIGYNPGSYNFVTVTDTGSSWRVFGAASSVLNVGTGSGGGAAHDNGLIITNGALVVSTNGTIGSAAATHDNYAIITGNGSLWTNSLTFRVGSAGYSNRLTVANGGRLVNTIGLIGDLASSSNNIAIVTDAGSVWSNISSLTVGDAGSFNQLVITNGGQVFSASGVIGNGATGNSNLVIVTDSGSRWNSSGTLTVGGAGFYNQLVITNAGQILAGGVIVGSTGSGYNTLTAHSVTNSSMGLSIGRVSSNNTVALTGNSVWDLQGGALVWGSNGVGNVLSLSAGSILTNVGGVTLGDSGTTMYLTNHQIALSGGGLNVGVPGSANSTLVVSNRTITSGASSTAGNGSSGNLLTILPNTVWNGAGQTITVGSGSATNNTLSIEGGMLSNAALTVGSSAGSVGNNVTVTGSGSTLYGGAFTVGDSGSSNSLLIRSGAIVTNATTTIGDATAGTYNSVVLNGATWTNSGVTVGWQGSYNRLVISNGAKFVGTTLGIGMLTGGSSNSVLITDSGTAVTLANWIRLGDNSGSQSYNQLVISNGAQVVNAANSTAVGNDADASHNLVIVTDPGSTWTLTPGSGAGFTIGRAATATGFYNGLILTNGGKLISPLGNIGGGSTSNGFVIVTGAGSMWTNTGALTIGTTGRSNMLSVVNGGTVVNSIGTVGSTSTSSNNYVLVTGPGSLWRNSSTVTVGNGTNAGNRILVNDGAILESSGLISTLDSVISNAGAVYQFNTATPTITTNGGSIVVNGGTISFRNVTAANVYGNSTGTQLTNMTFQGNNAFRLNNASNTTAVAQNYTFNTGLGATNYTRLEMVDGVTLWRSATLTVGSGGSMLASNTVGRVAASVTSAGQIEVVNSRLTWSSNVVLSGGYVSDPSTNIFATNLTITASGYLQGGAGDLFQFERDLILQSTQDNLYDLTASTVAFTNRLGQHLFNLTGSGADDNGSNFVGIASIVDNYAIGTLVLSPSDSLRLTGTVANALYVGALDIGGLANTNNLLLDINLYYDSNQVANAYLNGLVYDLAGNGLLIPYPGPGVPVIPEPAALFLFVLGASASRLRRARGTGQRD